MKKVPRFSSFFRWSTTVYTGAGQHFGAGAAFWDVRPALSTRRGTGATQAQGTSPCFPPCSAGPQQLPPPPSHAAQSHNHVPPDSEPFPREFCCPDAEQSPGAGFCRARPASGPSLTPAAPPALPLTQVRVPTLDGLAQGQLAPLHLQQQRDLLPGARLVLQQLWPAERASARSPRGCQHPPGTPGTLMASSVRPQS